MKKIFLTFLITIIFNADVFAETKIQVVATMPVFAVIAKEIGGDHVDVISLTKPNQDPHFIDPKPSLAVILNKADLLIYGGLGLEDGWLLPLLTQAKNPKIISGAKGNLDAAKGVSILEVPSGNFIRIMGDVHPQGNPHIWMDPRAIKILAVHLQQSLAQLDPAHATDYQQRLTLWFKNLNAKMLEWKKLSVSISGQSFISYHRSFSYLADYLGFKIMDTIESKPGIPPSSKRVIELLQEMEKSKPKAILHEAYYPQRLSEDLAQKSGVALKVIRTQPNFEQGETFVQFMDVLIRNLHE